MKTKLTLRMESETIERAKRYAEQHDLSLSRMVEDYFATLCRTRSSEPPQHGPRVSRLMGVIEGSNLDEEDYKEYLARKHA